MLRPLFIALLIAGSIASGPVVAQSPAPARHGMVVAQETRAARIGLDILQRGGNAVDAAVATGFALAVTYPRAGNLGGGGYMLIHLGGQDAAKRKVDTAIDYRETAPAAITRDIFLDDKGEADPQKSRDSALAIGVPGTVAGLALAHAKYGSGKFTLAQLLAPAIALARGGIPIEDDVADSLPRVQARLARWPALLPLQRVRPMHRAVRSLLTRMPVWDVTRWTANWSARRSSRSLRSTRAMRKRRQNCRAR